MDTGYLHTTKGKWWSLSGSNRRPEACKATALPAELRPLDDRDLTDRKVRKPDRAPAPMRGKAKATDVAAGA